MDDESNDSALLSVNGAAPASSGKPSAVRYWILGQFMCFTIPGASYGSWRV